MSALATVRHLCKNLLAQIKEMNAILADEPQMMRDVNQFISGYIFWHLASPRYRLSELTIPQANECYSLLYGGTWTAADGLSDCGPSNMIEGVMGKLIGFE